MVERTDEVVLEPIGIAHTPYETPDEAPHQGFADDEEARIEAFEQYADALAGIDDVVRLVVVYWADKADRTSLQGEGDTGAFAKRTPHRPNPVNICTCTLLERNGLELRIRGLDAIDRSPVLDIKPALQVER